MEVTYVACDKCGQINRVNVAYIKPPVCGSCQSELGIHDGIVEGRDSSVAKLINKSPLPVVVDVWAPWCGPCRSFAPTFKATAQLMKGKAVFVKLNSEDQKHFASTLGIRGIPTLIGFKKGQEVARISGALPEEQFVRWLQENLLS